jgi:hypothetical protein
MALQDPTYELARLIVENEVPENDALVELSQLLSHTEAYKNENCVNVSSSP